MDLSAGAGLYPLLKAAILGLVEGATEFIPVSSTGHLIVAGDWLGFRGEGAKTFEVFIQLGAILAVVWLYRIRFAKLVRRGGRDPVQRRLLLNLGLGFLPAAAAGFFARDAIKRYLFQPEVVAVALVVGGLVILAIERWHPPARVEHVDAIPPRTALGVGLAQVLALVPGTSRSAATIMGAYCLGLTRPAATEFSFFLAVPVMIAAVGYDLVSSLSVLGAGDIPVFAVGFAAAFLSAAVIVRGFVAYVARHSFSAFAWYRIGFGLLLLGWYARHPG